MNINRKIIKKIISAVEFFYDNSFKHTQLDKLFILGKEYLDSTDEHEHFEYEHDEPFEDLIDPQVVAVSQRQEYVVVFGVGATYQREIDDMFQSPGGSFVHNAFALVDMSGRRPLIKKFIVGRTGETKVKLLKKHLDSREFNHFNDRALRKDLEQHNHDRSYAEQADFDALLDEQYRNR